MSILEFYFNRNADRAVRQLVMAGRLLYVVGPVLAAVILQTFDATADRPSTLAGLMVLLSAVIASGVLLNRKFASAIDDGVEKAWRNQEMPASKVGETLSLLCELPHRLTLWDSTVLSAYLCTMTLYNGFSDEGLMRTSALFFAMAILQVLQQIFLLFALRTPLNRLRDLRGSIRVIKAVKPFSVLFLTGLLVWLSILFSAFGLSAPKPYVAYFLGVSTTSLILVAISVAVVHKGHKDLVTTIQQLLSGRFDLPALVFSPNHFGELALGLYSSVQSIKDKIVYLQRNGLEMYSTTHKISDLSSEQNKSLVRQSSAVTETSSTLEELVNSSTQISDLASRVVGYAEDTERHSEKGLQYMQKTALAIRNLDGQNRDSLKTIASLNEQMQEINRVLGLIHNIADETNLIALNAAIEASSAGEFGNRFKVVANEVRDLSDNVGRSIKEIQNMSQKIQSVMNDLIQSANHISSSMQASVDQSQKTYDFLKEILDWARKSSDAAKQIYIAINQQRLANKQISLSFTDISSDIQTLASTSQQYAGTIDVLKKFSANMEAVIQFFIKRSQEARLNEENS